MSSDLDKQSVEQASNLVERASGAQGVLARLSQEKVDAIVSAMARAALEESYRLGEMAHLETGYGIASDKALKNRFSAENVFNFIKPMRTVGIIRELDSVIEVASPRGVVAAVIPSTNPTSTAIFKILIAIKARDSIVLSPHPSATNCINETARLMREAGEAAGLPAGAIGCMSVATIEGTQALMKHKLTALILATGGIGLVRAAYSSGKPAFGVGPGNVPAMIERSADLTKAVKDILTGKCFDNGTICSSEQAVIVERAVDSQVREAFATEGAFFLDKADQDRLARVVVTPSNTLNSKIVGKSARSIAETAGISLADGIRAMICELEGVGKDYPLSMEKLSPILAYYVVDNLEEGCQRAAEVLKYGGMGHTASIHTRDRSAAREYGTRMPASRVIVSSPSTHGAIGFTTDLEPSMTLGCGSWGGNVTSDNISPRHLLDLKRIAFETHPINYAVSEERPDFTAPVTEFVSAAQRSHVDVEAIEALVDRFLAEREAALGHLREVASQQPPSPATPAAITHSAETQARRQSYRPLPNDASGGAVAASANGHIHDFVCEDDVKRAIAARQKIYINSKTIITPAARDLGDQHDVFARPQ
jgi:acetaldehyde dehydrogenase (acetylating)